MGTTVVMSNASLWSSDDIHLGFGRSWEWPTDALDDLITALTPSEVIRGERPGPPLGKPQVRLVFSDERWTAIRRIAPGGFASPAAHAHFVELFAAGQSWLHKQAGSCARLKRVVRAMEANA